MGQDYNDDVRVILFVTTKEDQELDEEKIKSIKTRIRNKLLSKTRSSSNYQSSRNT